MNTLETLQQEVQKYKQNRKTYDKAALQDIRDTISMCLFDLAEVYADSRFNSERAEFISKLERAKKEEELRGGVSKLTREQILNRARIECASQDEHVSEANRDYYYYRTIIETSNNILNSIASRINNI